MKPKIEIEHATVVVVGNFNPKIFHPLWFERHGLLQADELSTLDFTDSASGDLIYVDKICQFSIGWLDLQVLPDRFRASCGQQDRFEALRDLVASTFNLLKHTPVKAVGVNYECHVKLADDDARNAVGDRLGPKKPWQNHLSKPLLTNEKTEPPY